MTPRRPTAALLMEHQGFLKRLARSLVFDDQRAEDLVQDSFVVALERPLPAPARLRGWLAGIVRNAARRSHRTERRLRERHLRGARDEALPSTADMATRLEAQRTIAAAVEALDEPGRSALVYRYFDGHKPARIARDLGLPLRTVESRLRRAKASLRASLDMQFGERGTWQRALLPLIGGASWVGASSSSAAATGAGSATGTTAALGVTAMSSKAIAGFCIMAALAGAGIGWVAKPAPTPSIESGVVDAGIDDASKRDASPELQTDALVVAQARIKELERRVDAGQREASELRQKLIAARPASAATSPAEQRALARALKAPRYRYEAFDMGLAQLDWKKSAWALSRLSPLLPELAAGVKAGKPITDYQDKLAQFNLPLIEAAASLKNANVPGLHINGPLTHPAVAVNLVYATLVEAGVPLDEKQVEQLQKIGDKYVEQERAFREREAQEPYALASVLTESEIKDRMFQAIDQMVTEEQRVVLHPVALRDRVQGDLFSAGLIWLGHFQAAMGANREGIASRVSQMAIQHFQIPASDHAAVQRVVTDWVGSFDDATIVPLDQLEMAMFVKMERLRTVGRPMVDLYKELAREMASSPEIVKRIQASKFVLLPALAK